MSPDGLGFRGAVLLNPETYNVNSTLTIAASGVAFPTESTTPWALAFFHRACIWRNFASDWVPMPRPRSSILPRAERRPPSWRRTVSSESFVPPMKCTKFLAGSMFRPRGTPLLGELLADKCQTRSA